MTIQLRKRAWGAVRSGVLAFSVAWFGLTGPAQETPATGALEKIPLCFVENRGQLNGEVAFYLPGGDRTLFFTAGGVTFVLGEGRERWVVKLDFVGADPSVKPEGEARLPGVFSYFRGCPEEWKTGLPTYGKLVYRDLWPGVDLVYAGTVDRVKYSFVVHPGSDPDRIRLVYRGVNRLKVDEEGGLCIETGQGVIRDEPPIAFQDTAGRRVRVDVAFVAGDKSNGAGISVGFQVGEHDPTKPLIIDPAVFVYCGYLGGLGYDDIIEVAVDQNGNLYVTGGAGSDQVSFPVKTGPDLTYGGDGDVFVAKVDTRGTGLVYCGYLGGPTNDDPGGIAVDSAGAAYLTGRPGTGFPIKVGPNLKPSGGYDAFVTKINPKGTDLVYSGFIGGSEDDVGSKIAVDAAGNAYVTGYTESGETTFPVKVGPDLKQNHGEDGFVAKVNAQGTGLVYCGYIGGWYHDSCGSIAVDASGRAYVTGTTWSDEQTFPVKVGPDLTFCAHTLFWPEAFVARVNASGSSLDYCGYIGGSDFDVGVSIDVDRAGCAYVGGWTWSSEQTFPLKVGPDLSANGGGDSFVAKVASTGKDLVYCGYIGGSSSDDLYGIAVDSRGAAYATGYVSSSEKTFPVKEGPSLEYGGSTDAFVAKVRPDGTGLVYCGYIGGWGKDQGWGIAVNASGNAYVGGYTESDEQTFPVTVGPDLTHNKLRDGFVAKVSLTLLESKGSTKPGGRMNFTLTASEDPGLMYQLGSSFGTGPIEIDTRKIGLGYDGLLWISLSGLFPETFVDFSSAIGPDGHAAASLLLPDIAETIGLDIHTAFITLDPRATSGVKSISNTVTFKIT